MIGHFNVCDVDLAIAKQLGRFSMRIIIVDVLLHRHGEYHDDHQQYHKARDNASEYEGVLKSLLYNHPVWSCVKTFTVLIYIGVVLACIYKSDQSKRPSRVDTAL